MTEPRKHPPPWLFFFGGTAYGVAGAFTAQMMPFATGQVNIDLEDIGWFTALMFVPAVFQFLYAPIVDVGLPRRKWLVIMSILSGISLSLAFAMPLPDHLYLYLTFGFIAAAASALISAACGGLIAISMPDDLRGAASAWYNVGNLSGAGLSGWLAIELLGRDVEPALVGLTVAAFAILPAFALLSVAERRDDQIRSLGEVFGQTFHNVRDVLFTRSGLTGIALCISPVGTAALANFFARMGKDYGASPSLVANVSGLGSVALTAVGALVGGYLCDRHNRRAMYLLSGVLTAACGIVMALAPRTAETYAVGVCAYNLITGLCYAAFTATVLETIGSTGKAAGTRYAMFVSAGNTAIQYTGFIDTRFSKSHGVEGVIASDAILNLAGVVILGIVFWRLGSFGHRRHRDSGAIV